MLRIDLILTERKLAKSRSQAQAFIKAKRVSYKQDDKWLLTNKPSLILPSDIELKIAHDESDKYVSRGALKLEGALKHTQLNIQGFQVLDIGQSTGGFSDCALQHGAAHIVGIEVGHDQLDKSLRNNKQITCLEGVNARSLTAQDLGSNFPDNGFDLAVMDVSFISQTKILPQLPDLLSSSGHLITLVKPQFEVGPEFIGKGGIVKNTRRVEQLSRDIQAFVTELGFTVRTYIESPIKGGDGNREYLLWASKQQSNY
ncbi:TlyA family RNA methyltransferase [Marinomonas sp. C2222]|uniref:TlyA family RNA methyltransferase n=1 Tax=Marinomonas sargassi TaxID=2984494 RepID=A0ABT2YNG8_9GAMM|nr:TlyA family RNA methyltransferase [Marinomonas sargassi]MCV2401434.1 TlyA family RNA methyltransferase [Marinomonas sargassi]